MRGIYLDNSMAAKPSPRAIGAMLPFYNEFWGTPSAPHQGGYEVSGPLEASYRAIYRLLGASVDTDLLVATSSGAEAVNQVFHSIYWGASRSGGGSEYIVAATDEAPALMCVSRLEELGCRGVMAEPDASGVITADSIDKLITSKTALVSLSWGNGLTGLLHPAADIGALCRAKGIPFHCDVTHVLGKLACNPTALGATYLTFDGRPLHAPQGAGGLLFVGDALRHPLIVGGVEQACLRAGSVDIPALIGLGEASREADEERDYLCTEVARLRNKLEEGLTASCPKAQALFLHCERLPHIAVVAFPSVVNEALLFLLNRRKCFASIGGGSFQQLALILETCSIPPQLAHSCISFALSRNTTEEEIDCAIEVVAAAIQQLRATTLPT